MGLLDFMKRIPTMNEITGSFGERLTEFYASTFPGAYVLRDVLIDGSGDHKSQIDVLVIGNKGIYVVEVKTYSDAKIYGNTNNSTWYYYSYGKKYDIYSPLKQNQKHVQYLKNFLKDFGEIPCFSILTILCDDFKVSGDLDGKTAICSSLPAMKSVLYKLAEVNADVLDEAQKLQIYNFIQENQYAGKEARVEHKENVKTYTTSIEQMRENRICPYCKTELILRKGKYGAFYGCKNYPQCKYTVK